MIRVRKINHVALHADDATATAAFYANLFGFESVRPPAAPSGRREELQRRANTPPATGGAWVALPGAELHFIAAERASGTPNPFGPHLAFEVEDFDGAKRELEANGVRFVEAPDMIEVRQLWFLDPSGNTIELWSKKASD